MPYKSEQIPLSREQDRRIKLTEEQREEIRYKYSTGQYSQRQLANEYGVSRRLITFVLDPSKEERSRNLFKERRRDGRYNVTKEKRAATQREHRHYKHILYLKGELKKPNEYQEKK